MSRAKLNYLVDLTIGVAFLSSAISGLIFLLPISVNWGIDAGVLGISYRVWNELHTWSSVAMILGVMAHIVLHWKWLVTMTKRAMPTLKRQKMRGSGRVVATASVNRGMKRRDFLRVGGIALVGMALFLAGYKVSDTTAAVDIDKNDGSEGTATDLMPSASQQEAEVDDIKMPDVTRPSATATPGGSTQVGGIACPFGVVNDPYPGRCRFYRDNDRSGFCDHSEPS